MATLLAAVLTLTIEDHATMPVPSAPQLSPDASRIAYVVTRADLARNVYDPDVWLIDADGGNNRQITQSPRSDNHPRWSPDGKTIAFLSDRDGVASIYLISIAGGEAAKLTSEPAAIRDFAWSPDAKTIAFNRFDEAVPSTEARVVGEGRRYAHLYTIDVASKEVRRLTRGDFSIFDLDWSPDGTTIAFTRGPGLGLDEQYRTDIYTIPADGGEMRALVVRPGIDWKPAYAPDGKSIAFLSGGGVHDWLVDHKLSILTLADRTIRTIASAYGRTTEEPINWSTDSATIWFGGPLNTTAQLFRINAEGTGFTNVSNVEGVIQDAVVRSGRAAFIYQTLTTPPELWVSDLPSPFAPRRLTDINAGLRGRVLGETRLIRWKNPKDGMEIEGLLTLPVGYTPGRRVPLLTWIHGGPASTFDQRFLGYLGFIYAPQVLASRGFAVLRPNPRGTGGYGERFRQANRNDWAIMPLLDVYTGIDTVIAQGIADPKRLGLMGWSYGGFLTAWALGHGAERFRAFSIGAPVVDLLSFHGTSDIRDFIPFYFEGRRLDEWRAQSPLWHLKKIDAPVLIQHGENDERVPLSQGTMLYRILQELGVDVTMVIYPRTPHTPREPKLRIDAMRRNLEFFMRHVGTEPPSSPVR
jgi:dipeptidyl aminopeptidase/acylaminoacyl peptidase